MLDLLTLRFIFEKKRTRGSVVLVVHYFIEILRKDASCLFNVHKVHIFPILIVPLLSSLSVAALVWFSIISFRIPTILRDCDDQE